MYSKKLQKFNFSYDPVHDDLFLFNPGSKSKGSVEWGDLILDFNNKKELVAIQFINASTFIKDLIKEKNMGSMKDFLQHLTESKVELISRNNITIAKIYFISSHKEAAAILPIPMIKESSPALVA